MKRVSKQVGIMYYKYINSIQLNCLNKKNVYTRITTYYTSGTDKKNEHTR